MLDSIVDSRYKDPALPVNERVDILLAQMTVEEKVAQITGNGVMAGKFHDISREIPNGAGHINGTFLRGEADAEARAETIAEIQRYMVENTRLGIPALFHMETTSGSFYTDAAVTPVAIAMGATFDRETVGKMAEIIGRQNRAEGYVHAFGPVLDVGRDQRWGRLGESYGEEPTHISAMGTAFVKGLEKHVGATGKHFFGYGMGEDGRNIGNQRIPDRELREVHLKPWAAVVDAGMSSVMNSYGVINGEPVITSSYILKDLLRDELGFDGLVVADYCSVDRCIEDYKCAANITEAGIMALNAGLDVELPDAHGFNDEFIQMIKDGKISMDRIDQAVRRVLELKFRLGIFEKPYPDFAAIGKLKASPENRQVSNKLARESIVMTKNNGLLPLKKGVKVAVIGPNGGDLRSFYGGYSYAAMLEMKANLTKMFIGMEGMGGAVEEAKKEELLVITDIEDEIRRRYPDAATMIGAVKVYAPEAIYAHGCEIESEDESGFAEAIAAAENADVVILALGGRGGWVEGCTSGEGVEHPAIGLFGVQQKLALAVAAVGKPVVTVHMDVRPMADPKVTNASTAVLECWHGGTYGASALADVLFGEFSPSGRLPLTCLAGPEQNPIYLGQLRGCGHVSQNAKNAFSDDRPGPMGGRQTDPYAPLFCFGHGLSYTSFEYSNMRLSQSATGVDGSVKVSVTVKNTGAVAADEVVQLYFRDDLASMIRPSMEMAGFARISLNPGESKTAVFTFDASQTAFLASDNQWTVEPGTVTLMIGAASDDIRLHQKLELTGVCAKISSHRTYFSEVEVK